MSATTTTPQLRWSSVKDCPRKAVYGATNAPARERTDREARILYRGRSLGRDYADWLVGKYGEENVLREVQVVWPLGVGHMDVYLVPTKTAIEVLSSAHASESMIRSKLIQLVGYMEFYEPAENGCLIVLDPADFTEERFPVAKGTVAYEALVEDMNDRLGQLEEWRSGGTLPARVCRKPSEAIGRFCLHAEYCFNDEPEWVSPQAEELASVEAERAADRVFNLKIPERQAKDAYDVAVAERKMAESELSKLVDTPGTFAVGPWTVVRTDVQRKPTLDTKKAELAGMLNVEALAEAGFFKPGASYSTWAVTRADFPSTVEVDPESYGEVPF